MSHDPVLNKPLKIVHRRLALREFGHRLTICWSWSLAAVACYFVPRSLFWGADPTPIRWGLFGSAWLLGAMAAAVWTLWKAPKAIDASLALDRECGLRERATTWLLLTPEQRAHDAGLILKDDVERQLAKVDVAAAFPLQPRWRRLAVPGFIAAVCLALLFISPHIHLPGRTLTEPQKSNLKEVALQLENIKKTVHIPKKADHESSKEMKELEHQWDKILKKDINPQDENQVRETIQELRDLQDKMKDRVDDLKNQLQQNQSLKNALDQLAKQDLNKLSDGPAKDLRDSLANKETNQAAQAIEKLIKKLEDKTLSPEDQAKLQKQLQELRELMQKMRDVQEKEREKLNRELKELRDRLENLEKDPELKKIEDALDKGDVKKAIEELDKLSKKTNPPDLEKQIQVMKDRLKQMVDQPPEQQQRELQQLKDRLSKMSERMQKLLEQNQELADELQRQLDQLGQELDDLGDLEDLEDLLEQCEKCLGGKDGDMAGKKLKLLKGKLEKMKLTEEELEKLLQDKEKMDEMLVLLMQGLKSGQGMGGKSKLPGGVRPVGKEPDTKAKNEKQKVELDTSGKIRITGTSKGGTFSKIPAKEVGGAFQQAVQEAPEAIDRQRIPAEAADIAKGYFQKLGGQK